MEIAVAEHHRTVGGQLGEHVGGDDADVWSGGTDLAPHTIGEHRHGDRGDQAR